MKYIVEIPQPSAKRLKHVKLTIELSDGWVAYKPRVYDLTNQTSFEFEVDDDFDYLRETSVIDGPNFDVYVEFSNDSGSRKEKIHLTPKRI